MHSICVYYIYCIYILFIIYCVYKIYCVHILYIHTYMLHILKYFLCSIFYKHAVVELSYFTYVHNNFSGYRLWWLMYYKILKYSSDWSEATYTEVYRWQMTKMDVKLTLRWVFFKTSIFNQKCRTEKKEGDGRSRVSHLLMASDH